MRFIAPILLILPLLAVVHAGADEASTQKRLAAAIESPERSEADRERDANRKPAETLTFFGLRDDMKVLELVPGGGWYTTILAPVLADEGKLYVAIGTGRVESGLLKQPGYDKVEVIDVELNARRDGPFGTNNIDAVDFGVTGLDLALTFRNLHNFTPEARALMNAAVFDALKPGGLYGVVDHTARHMAPLTGEGRRRLDPVVAIEEILDAGFEFVAFSDLHYRPDDELRYEVGRASVTGNSDRFTLLFRKPE